MPALNPNIHPAHAVPRPGSQTAEQGSAGFTRPVGRVWTQAVILLALTCCLAAAAYRSPWQPRKLLIRAWQAEWETLTAAEVKGRCAQLAALGPDGLTALVETTCSPRDEVAAAAAEQILRTVDGWRDVPVSQSSPWVVRLVRNLADQIDRSAPSARHDLHRVATRLLSWPLSGTGPPSRAEPRTRAEPDRLAFLADCETILAATRLEPLAVRRSATSPDYPSLPQLAARIPVPPEVNAAPRVTTPPIIAPLHPGIESRVGVGQFGESSVGSDPDLNSRLTPSARPSTERASPQSFSLSTDPVSATPDSLRPVPSEFRLEPVHELQRRGFSPLQVELARRVLHPDVAVRLRLIRELPGLPIDARPWLLWLAEDPDSQVREDAVRLMATSTDPELLRRVREFESTNSTRETRHETLRSKVR